MEVALMALGAGLIIASFRIHSRYLEIAKKYYNKQLDIISNKLEKFLVNKKNELEISQFLGELSDILDDFYNEIHTTNFPKHLLYGFSVLGIYVIVIGLLYEQIIIFSNNSYSPETTMTAFAICIFTLALVPGLIIFNGLRDLIKVTQIV